MNRTSKKNLILVSEIERICDELGIPCIAGPYLSYLATRTSRAIIPTSVMFIPGEDHEKLLEYLRKTELKGRSVEVVPVEPEPVEEPEEDLEEEAEEELDYDPEEWIVREEDLKPLIRYADTESTYIDLRDHTKYECDGINVMIEPIENRVISRDICLKYELSRNEALSCLINERQCIDYLGFEVYVPEDMDLYRKLLTDKVRSFPLEVVIVDPYLSYGKSFALIGKDKAEELRNEAMAGFDKMTELADENRERHAIMVEAMTRVRDVYKEEEKRVKAEIKKREKKNKKR